jgi:hypothetical protein
MTDISGQSLDEIMILKKDGMQLYVSLLVFFYEIAIAQECIFVRNGYPSPCALISMN